jgi:hypothetical protein
MSPLSEDKLVSFESKDAVTASAAIVAAVAAGELTPMEAAELSKVIDNYARTLQSVEFEERLAKLEKAIPK